MTQQYFGKPQGDSLKMRILMVKKDLKELIGRTYVQQFIDSHPAYNNMKKTDELRNVLACVKANEQITVDLEQYLNEIRAVKA